MSGDPTSLYLGDGVYARFDGYQIWLAANHHLNDVIALEPDVMKALIRYANQYMKLVKQENKDGV